MANATVSFLGKANNTGDDNALFLKVFSGEVLAAFARQNKMLPMTMVRTISQGKSAQFPAIGKTTASYHTPGNELTGSVINKNERVITIDDLLVSDSFISQIDEAKNHYDIRSIYSTEMGNALARTVDEHLLQLSVLAARAATTVSGGSGGEVITDADANTNATSLITSIFDAAEALDEKDVPEDDRYCVVAPATYYNLVENDKILNRDFGGDNGAYMDGKVLKVAGINIVKSNTAVSAFTDLSAASTTGHNNTYTGNFSTTVATVFHKSAVGTVKLMDLAMESEYDIRRQGTLMVAKMALGHGILRPEAAVEIKTA
jgi:N4-gp56 family major capsid protein